jgi:DNA-binding transcriptional ArsR family regulator
MLSLKESEKNVTQLYKDLEVEQSKISHALASLKSCNIVKSRQNGKQRIYYLNKTTIPKILELTDEHAKSFCGKPYCSCDRSKCMKNMRR